MGQNKSASRVTLAIAMNPVAARSSPEQLQNMSARFAPVRLRAELKNLSPGGRAATLKRINTVPVDIRPVFVTANEAAPAPGYPQ